MTDIKPKIIVVYGATASGKSSFALKLADNFNGTIINADSVQVYEDLQILTARPDLSLETIPHKLYGFLKGSEDCSAGIWSKLAVDEIKKCQTPIVVGGTGLYIEALIKGLSPIPDVDPGIKAKYRNPNYNVSDLYKLLKEKDVEMSNKINSNDRQRIVRALEVYEATGKSLLYWQEMPSKKPIDADFINIFINPDREKLYNKCNSRFDKMIEIGAVEEVKSLMNKKYSSTAPIMKALGVNEINSFLNKEITLEEAVEKAKTKTRRYAKRQITWFKNRFDTNLIVRNSRDNLEIKQIFNSLRFLSDI